jgi:hypothetical protein
MNLFVGKIFERLHEEENFMYFHAKIDMTFNELIVGKYANKCSSVYL